MKPTKINPLHQRSLARWYPLKPHPIQDALVRDSVRFKVVPAGRRSGKTERAKRFIVAKAYSDIGAYFVAAPTRPQVKRIYWDDLKLLSLSCAFPLKPLEAELIIRLPNGSTITLIGLDEPSRIEGSTWAGGIVDEIANVKPDAWDAHISPALNTFSPEKPDYRPWCWLIGVPDMQSKSVDAYLKMRDLGKSSNPDWATYEWKSADILPSDVIDAERSRLDPKIFRQEYEGSFETVSGRIYDDFGPENETLEVIDPKEELLWCHDFNYTPLSSAICVRRDNIIYILDEIVLRSAIARQSAIEFVDRYKNHENKKVIVYGDPAGKAGEKHGHASDYTEIEAVLRSSGWTVTRKVKAAAPAIKDRQNAVRAKILNAKGDRSLFVHPKAEYSYQGLRTVQLKPGSTFQEADGDYQHITTAIGYMVEYEWPVTRFNVTEQVEYVPQVNFWG